MGFRWLESQVTFPFNGQHTRNNTRHASSIIVLPVRRSNVRGPVTPTGIGDQSDIRRRGGLGLGATELGACGIPRRGACGGVTNTTRHHQWFLWCGTSDPSLSWPAPISDGSFHLPRGRW